MNENEHYDVNEELQKDYSQKSTPIVNKNTKMKSITFFQLEIKSKKTELDSIKRKLHKLKREYNEELRKYSSLTKSILTKQTEADLNLSQIAKIEKKKKLFFNLINKDFHRNFFDMKKQIEPKVYSIFLNFCGFDFPVNDGENYEIFETILKNEKEMKTMFEYVEKIQMNLLEKDINEFNNQKKQMNKISSNSDNIYYPFDLIFEYFKDIYSFIELKQIEAKNTESLIQLNSQKNSIFKGMKTKEGEIINSESYYNDLNNYIEKLKQNLETEINNKDDKNVSGNYMKFNKISKNITASQGKKTFNQNSTLGFNLKSLDISEDKSDIISFLKTKTNSSIVNLNNSIKMTNISNNSKNDNLKNVDLQCKVINFDENEKCNFSDGECDMNSQKSCKNLKVAFQLSNNIEFDSAKGTIIQQINEGEEEDIPEKYIEKKKGLFKNETEKLFRNGNSRKKNSPHVKNLELNFRVKSGHKKSKSTFVFPLEFSKHDSKQKLKSLQTKKLESKMSITNDNQNIDDIPTEIKGNSSFLKNSGLGLEDKNDLYEYSICEEISQEQNEKMKINQINFKRPTINRNNGQANQGNLNLKLEKQINCDCCMTSCT